MSLFFRTLRSGSSGNSVLLCADGYAVIVDLGLPVRTALKEILGELRQKKIKLLGALITHEHSDHFSPGALRAMRGLELPVWACGHTIRFAEGHPDLGYFSGRPELRRYDEGEHWERAFEVGPFRVQPVEVTHHPKGCCFAFHIRVEGKGGREINAVVATDLCDPRGLPGYLVNADLIYLESNYDPHLLKMKPNPASHFHLENSRCGKLLVEARKASERPPQKVFLGHLSTQRNSESLAKAATRGAFEEGGVEMDFGLECAPRHLPSVWVEVE